MKQAELNKEIIKMRAQVCKALANPIRMMIIDALKMDEFTAGDLALALDVSSTSLSQHLSVLRNVGIVQARREGKFIYYSLTDARVVQACNLMSEVLLERLKNMELLSKQLTEDSLGK